MRRRRLLILVVAAVALLTACQVDATVSVRMREDGSGTVVLRVRLDEAAVTRAEEAGGNLEQLVELDDLPDAGWRVSRWRRDDQGSATVRITKAFTRPGQIAGIVAELGGAQGPLRGFSGRRDASTFSTDWQLRGTVDLEALTAGVTDDADLVANLTARRIDANAVELRLAEDLRGLTVRARLQLPDGTTKVATVAAGKRAGIEAVAQDTDVRRIALVIGGIGAVLVALLVFLVGERSVRRRRSQRPANIPRRAD